MHNKTVVQRAHNTNNIYVIYTCDDHLIYSMMIT